MNACDIIFKTKRKQPLSAKEMKWLINGYVSGEVPDYQVSAWLMAVCLMLIWSVKIISIQ